MKLKEIAAIANVSPSTISLVINGRDGDSYEKRKQITKLLNDYGYEVPAMPPKDAPPVGGNKSIRFIKFKRHAMLVDGNPGFVNSIVDAIEIECRRQRYVLQMTSCSNEQLPGIIEAIREEPAAGILLLGTELSDVDISMLPNFSVPMVVIDNYLPFQDFNCITMNNREAIFRSVEYLASLGHSRIGFLANALASNNCNERRMAFQSALVQQGLAYDGQLVFEVHPTPDGAYQSVHTLLEQGARFPSALVANNDSIALGAIKAFKEFSIRVPEDISIVGFDNIPFSGLSDPPLTTMEVSCKEMGIWSVRLLCDLIRYPFSAITKMQISTRLVVRSSTAPFRCAEA